MKQFKVEASNLYEEIPYNRKQKPSGKDEKFVHAMLNKKYLKFYDLIKDLDM